MKEEEERKEAEEVRGRGQETDGGTEDGKVRMSVVLCCDVGSVRGFRTLEAELQARPALT